MVFGGLSVVLKDSLWWFLVDYQWVWMDEWDRWVDEQVVVAFGETFASHHFQIIQPFLTSIHFFLTLFSF